MKNLNEIHGLLLDLDGVFYVGNQVIDGACETIARIKASGLPYRFVTNTTTQTRSALCQKLQTLGLAIEAEDIITSPYAARLYLRQQGYRSCHLLLADEVKQEFEEFASNDAVPEAVVVGDIGDAWNYELLNRVFQMLMAGAQLIALHKNKFWQTEQGLRMDIGAFVTGLEYVSGKQAIIMGKPSPAFFGLAMQQLQLAPNRVAMFGDDIDSDIGGAQQLGMQGILVKTGKYRQAYAEASAIKPDLVIDSVANLADYF